MCYNYTPCKMSMKSLVPEIMLTMTMHSSISNVTAIAFDKNVSRKIAYALHYLEKITECLSPYLSHVRKLGIHTAGYRTQ